MRSRNWIAIGSIASLVMLGALPRGLSAQRRSEAVSASALTVVVPSIIRTMVDPSAEAAGGGPVIRVVTNDPVLRAALAAGGAPGLAMSSLRLGGEGPSHHAKGGESAEASAETPRVMLYTITSP